MYSKNLELIPKYLLKQMKETRPNGTVATSGSTANLTNSSFFYPNASALSKFTSIIQPSTTNLNQQQQPQTSTSKGNGGFFINTSDLIATDSNNSAGLSMNFRSGLVKSNGNTKQTGLNNQTTTKLTTNHTQLLSSLIMQQNLTSTNSNNNNKPMHKSNSQPYIKPSLLVPGRTAATNTTSHATNLFLQDDSLASGPAVSSTNDSYFHIAKSSQRSQGMTSTATANLAGLLKQKR